MLHSTSLTTLFRGGAGRTGLSCCQSQRVQPIIFSHSLRKRRQLTVWRCQRQDNAQEARVALPLGISVSDKIYLVAEVAVLVVQLALVDAAYSGDWSRVGAITREQEDFLKPIVNFIIIAHAILGVITAQQAHQRGLDPLASGVKGFLFGSMELWKVLQHPGQTGAGNTQDTQ